MGDVIQIRDHQSRRQREQAQAALEAQAMEIANICFPSIICTGNDTAPSEMPFHAPDKDSA